MPKARPAPDTFDAWLGDTIDGLIDAFGGRSEVAALLDVSQKTVQRKLAGKPPFTISELERIADLVRVPAQAIVTTALSRYGDGDPEIGKARMLAESKGRNTPPAATNSDTAASA
jgi:hypothetical protein